MSFLLQELLTKQAELFAGRTAVVMGQEHLTYGELEAASNQLARLLKDSGCERGDRVCVFVPKSPMALIGILGILKADCIYVPLDTSSPVPRLAKIVDACTPRYILAAGTVCSHLDDLMAENARNSAISVGWLGEGKAGGAHFNSKFTLEDLRGYSCEPLNFENRSGDPAHILFTSGSTGVPKGVVITHSNVIHFVNWAVKYFGIAPGDRISGHPPLHFDLSTFDIYGTFSVGAELHLVPPELNLLPHKLAEFIRRSELTQWFSVPSALNYMAKHDVVQFNDFPTLKRLLWCGEVFPTPALIYWMKRLPKVTFTNLYGPTEATIASSYYTVPGCPVDESAPIPIGTACEGEELLVLNEALQPVWPEERGDLYIGGVGLSPGYWQDPQKTTAVFLPHPASPNSGHRIYKTGDLARIGHDGLVYYIGRADSQVKSRGYRIELGEIESALNSLNQTAEVAVVGVETGGFDGITICAAYVPLPGVDVSAIQLRGAISKSIPSYMLPSRWKSFERLPKNGNGKIDRPQLKQQFCEDGTQPMIRSLVEGQVK